jgi:NAD(P)H-hydrate epimerase
MKLENPLKSFVEEIRKYDLVVDALFGFPFQGEMREPYRTLIAGLKEVEERVLAVDIPSGWDADLGNTRGLFTPGCVVSLGMPKVAMKGFKGRHFLGGRFIPEKLAEEMNI